MIVSKIALEPLHPQHPQDFHHLEGLDQLQILHIRREKNPERNRTHHVNIKMGLSNIIVKTLFSINHLLIVIVVKSRPHIENDVEPKNDQSDVVEILKRRIRQVEKTHLKWQLDRVDQNQNQNEQIPILLIFGIY